jgi:hypothetical protein
MKNTFTVILVFLALLFYGYSSIIAAETFFSVESVTPGKIFSPGDAIYNYFEIKYDDPYGATGINGKIYNLYGALIDDMLKDSAAETLRWYGNDFNGNPAPLGVYIYQIEVTGQENKVITGTIVLVR